MGSRVTKQKIRQPGYIRVPNWVDDDTRMYDTTRLVLVALLSRLGSRGSVCLSQQELADITGCCRNTVAKALAELEERGILLISRRYYYSRSLHRIVRGKNRYRICRRDVGGFTLVPRALLAEDLTPAQFTVALHVYRLAGRKGRCYPSVRLLARQVDRAKSTVCRAVKALWLRQVVSRLRCRQANRAYACNSYYPTGWIREKGANPISAFRGGLKFEQSQVTKKITVGSILRKEEKGVGEFGGLNKKLERILLAGQYHFDGVGVKVSFPDELELIG